MLGDHIDIVTLLICTFLATAVVAIFLTLIWLRDRTAFAVGVWCLALWTGVVSCMLLGLRAIGPEWLSIGIGNALAILAYAILWAGFKAFDGSRAHPVIFLAGPVLWLVCYFGLSFHNDANARVVLASLSVSAYSLLVAVDVYGARHREALPCRPIITSFFALHGLVYFLRIPFAIMMPLEARNIMNFPVWFSIFNLELFVSTIVIVVSVLALTLERAQHRYRILSFTDELTGISNRRSFTEQVEALLMRPNTVGALMILDIDHFKRINDTWGHIAGDRVLKRFAEIVTLLVEQNVLFGRIGGEEFALFLPNAGVLRGLALGETLRREVEGMAMDYEGHRVDISVSVGVSCVGQVGTDFDRLHKAADCALYEAKRSGRNAVRVFSEDMLLRSCMEYPPTMELKLRPV